MVKIMIIFGEYYVAAEDQSENLLRENHTGDLIEITTLAQINQFEIFEFERLSASTTTRRLTKLTKIKKEV